MSEDRELTAMGKVFAEMQPLDGEERKRVLLWLAQKLSVDLGTSQRHSASSQVGGAEQGTIDFSTDTIATVVGAKSGPDLIIAAAAHCHFVLKKQKFTRQELIEQMRTAPGHFKETFVNNMSSYLTGLTKADRLRLVATGTYALSVKERQSLEAKLANAG